MNKIKDFFARYGGTIGRILVNHIAMSIFGLLVGIAAYGIHPLLYWGACVLGVGMYMFLLYMVMCMESGLFAQHAAYGIGVGNRVFDVQSFD